MSTWEPHDDSAPARPSPWQPATEPPPLAGEIAEPDQDQQVHDGPDDAEDQDVAQDRDDTEDPPPAPTPSAAVTPAEAIPATRPDIVLVEDSRHQGLQAAPAADLFTGDLFEHARAYARSTGAPWFILSSEYGLLAPEQVVGPYERTLSSVSPAYREAWAAWVLARLEESAGPVRRSRVEVHAESPAASEALRRQLHGSGALVVEPLRRLPVADRIEWYNRLTADTAEPIATAVSLDEPEAFEAAAVRLGDATGAAGPSQLLASVDGSLRRPGIYSWFVDTEGARQLSSGLGAHVAPGLVWLGQAGAIRPGSVLTSTTTLRNRLAWVHLGRSTRLSPLRQALGSVLARVPEAQVTSEDALTNWMYEHLSLVTIASDEPERLGDHLQALTRRLAPQLNRDHAADPEVRAAVARARGEFAGFAASDA